MSIQVAVRYHLENRLAEAEQAYRACIANDPANALAHINLGTILHGRGEIAEGIRHLENGVRLNPGIPEGHNNLGNAYRDAGRLEEAVAACRHALSLRAGWPSAHNNLGNALKELGRLQEAIREYQAAIDVNPGNGRTHHNLASALQAAGEFQAALAHFQRATELEPANLMILLAHYHLKRRLCDWAGLEPMENAIRAGIEQGQAAPPLPVLSIWDDPEIQRKAAENYANSLLPLVKQCADGPRGAHPAMQGGKIRIGYLSADFRGHAVTYLLCGVIEAHDRNSFEVYGYSLGEPDGSPYEERIRSAFDLFLDCASLTDDEIYTALASRDLDILIDLTGHTHRARGRVLARRPARAIVSWLGYPATTGASYVDFLIADDVLIPEEMSDQYAEEIVRIPGCFQPNDRQRHRPADDLDKTRFGLSADRFVFCCFNNTHKLNATFFDTWVGILAACPESILWLHADNRIAQENLLERAINQGMREDRIVFADYEPDYSRQLERLSVADLYLDCMPFGAGTTASDTLWAGTPILTMQGHSYSSRMAASLLQAVALPGFVTSDVAAYVETAKRYYGNRDAQRETREKLRGQRYSCALFDTAATTRNLEAAYRRIADERRGIHQAH